MVLNLRGRDVVLFNGKYMIGRSAKCHIVIDDQRISRRHARLDVYDDSVSITDLGSANGVKINGVRVLEGAHELRHGDMIEIAREQLRQATPGLVAVAILALGLVYAWRKRVLRWV